MTDQDTKAGSLSAPKVYKSPQRKLVRFFEKSRDQWKAKCRETKALVKRLKNRVRWLEHSRDRWKRQAQALEAELAQARERQQALEAQVAQEKKPRMSGPRTAPS
jgi:hypothetical protein